MESSLETRAALFRIVSRVVELLSAARYTELEVLSNGKRLNADQMREAVEDYSCRLVALPADAEALMDVVAIINHPAKWSVVQPLFSAEEGRSDLSLLLTVTRVEDGFSVEIDDIHVL